MYLNIKVKLKNCCLQTDNIDICPSLIIYIIFIFTRNKTTKNTVKKINQVYNSMILNII